MGDRDIIIGLDGDEITSEADLCTSDPLTLLLSSYLPTSSVKAIEKHRVGESVKLTVARRDMDAVTPGTSAPSKQRAETDLAYDKDSGFRLITLSVKLTSTEKLTSE